MRRDKINNRALHSAKHASIYLPEENMEMKPSEATSQGAAASINTDNPQPHLVSHLCLLSFVNQ